MKIIRLYLFVFFMSALFLFTNTKVIGQTPDKYPMRERFGFVFNVNNCPEGCNERNVDEFNYLQLGASWYWDGGYGFLAPLGGFRNNLSYMAMIGPGVRFDAPSSPTDTKCNTVRNTILNRFPSKYRDGMMWVVGNEIGWDDQRTAQDYADEYVKWRNCLKSINSTFQVGSGSIIQFNMQLPDSDGVVTCVDYNNPQSGKNYFINYITTIRNQYGEDKLPDFITNHGYTPCDAQRISSTQNWANTNLFRESVRIQRQTMKDLGLENKDLIIKEIAPLPIGATSNNTQYMIDTINYLATAKDPTIGNPTDDGRLVQKWSWFVFNNWKGTTLWPHLELFDTNTTLIKPLGTTYKNLISQFVPSPTPDPCPRGSLGNIDCSLDGCINSSDFNIFKQDFGKSVNQISNLYNDQSQYIDTADYEILRQNYLTCN